MSRSPLLQKLLDEQTCVPIHLQTHEAFVADAAPCVLFFSENPKRFPESNDVAVVLPQLLKQFPGLRAGLVDESAERQLQQRYGFNSWPALVVLREGGYLGSVTGMQDWAVYVQEIAALLQSETVRPPSFSIPVVVEAN